MQDLSVEQLDANAVSFRHCVRDRDGDCDVLVEPLIELHRFMDGSAVGQSNGNSKRVANCSNGVEHFEGLEGSEGVEVEAVDGDVGRCDEVRIINLIYLSR